MTTDPRARQHRRIARDVAMRRISAWTTALALGSVVGSGAVAVVARAATQAGAGTVSTNSSGGAQTNPSDQGDGSGTDSSGGLQPPREAPMPQLQQAPALGSSGGS